MPVRKSVLAVTAVAAFAVVSLAACSSPSSSPSQSVPAPSVSSTQVETSVLVDVRTPAEFKAGHLQGAVNIPVETPDFAQVVSSTVGSASVQLYCRSGNRSGQAAQMLQGAGFNVTDLGAYEAAAAATGLPTVN